MAAHGENEVTNGGSAIGEAIGAHMEASVQKVIKEFVANYGLRFISDLGKGQKPGSRKKLTLPDGKGNSFSIDGLVMDAKGHPLVLLESKYIRYTKHNKDKGSWICNVHSALRGNFKSIKSSIAVLAGNWSAPSLEMLTKSKVQVFLIQFDTICTLLDEYGIDFRWKENDAESAQLAWEIYDALSEEQKTEIGERMVDQIKPSLCKYLKSVFENQQARKLTRLLVEFETNLGERLIHSFTSAEDAIQYLDVFDLEKEFDESSFVSIYDIVTEEEIFDGWDELIPDSH